jgi:glutamyl-tRNA synthetase
LSEVKTKTKTIDELIESIEFIFQKRPIKLNEKATEILTTDAKKILSEIKKNIETLDTWDINNIEQLLKDFSSSKGLKFKDLGLPLRAVLTGTLSSPSIYNVLDCLGKDEVLNRIDDVL